MQTIPFTFSLLSANASAGVLVPIYENGVELPLEVFASDTVVVRECYMSAGNAVGGRRVYFTNDPAGAEIAADWTKIIRDLNGFRFASIDWRPGLAGPPGYLLGTRTENVGGGIFVQGSGYLLRKG